MFAFAFSKVSRYREFLEITLERYRESNQSFFKNLEATKDAFPPANSIINEQQQEILDEGRRITTLLHLEIESFYLFAKILLDKMARATEFYFGQVRSYPLDSHDDLSRNITTYANANWLTPIPEKLSQFISQLKKEVSDHRDREIAHEKSPRTLKVTTFNYATSLSTIASTKLYPKESDQQVESKPPTESIKLIDEYIEEMILYLTTNRNKTALELER